jgi:hypothetical protein
MGRGNRPFLFCRYSIENNGEVVRPEHQFTFLQEMQGQKAPHGRSARESGHFTTLLMRPRQLEVDGFEVLTWSAGFEAAGLMAANYDPAKDDITLASLARQNVRYADFVAVPSLGVFAVDDRVNDILIGGKAAINRLKTVVSWHSDAELVVASEATPEEVKKALSTWELTQFRFTIRPNNPRPVSRLAEELSEQMKADGIGKLTGVAKPSDTGNMKMADEGFIRSASDLVDAGYGQSAIAGITEDGLRAEIKKPPFSEDRQKNEQLQAKDRELRVFVDAIDMGDDEIHRTAARSLIQFYHEP